MAEVKNKNKDVNKSKEPTTKKNTTNAEKEKNADIKKQDNKNIGNAQKAKEKSVEKASTKSEKSVDNTSNLEMWRHEWEVLQNQYLEKAGSSERIDMRSYERQGNDLVPTVHLGRAASAMERRGIHTFLGDLNREIKEHNRLVLIIKRGLTKLKEWADNRQERKQMREAEKAALGPPIRSVLAEFIWQRQSGRADWYNKNAKLKWFAKDVADIRTAIDWLEEKD